MTVRLGIGHGEGGLPFEDRPPLFLLDLTPENRLTHQSCQPFDSGYQRIYRLATRHCFLRYL